MYLEATKQGEETREKILQCIIQYIEKHGYPPSVRELCEMTGLHSTGSVHRQLKTMIEMGVLETDEGIGMSRAIRVPGYKFVKG